MSRFVVAILPVLLVAGCISQQPAPTVDRIPSAAAKPAVAPQLPSGPGYYTVKKGDTLYRIALEHGQDQRDIAAWNNIVNPASIKEGQVLRVTPPGSAAAEAGGAAMAKPVMAGPAVETRPLDQAGVAVAPSANDQFKREPRVGKLPYSDEAYARLNKLPEATDKPGESKPEAKPEQVPATAAAPGPDDVIWAWPSTAKLAASFGDAGNKGIDFAGKAGDPVLAAADGKVLLVGNSLRGYGELVIVKHNASYLSAYANNRKILVKEGQQVTRGQKIAEMGKTDSETVKLHFEIRKQGKPVDPALYLPKR